MKEFDNFKLYLDKKLEWGFCNYLTEFRYDSKTFHKEVCFAKMRDKIGDRVFDKLDFSIKICLTDRLYNDNNSHLVLINSKQIHTYLSMLASVLGFKYRTKYKKDDLIISVTINKNVNKRKALLIATSIRYLYEFPYNITLIDALKIKNENPFKRENILNCILTVGSVLQNGSLGGGHGLGLYISGPYRDELKEKKLISLITPKKTIQELIGFVSCNDIFKSSEVEYDLHRFDYIKYGSIILQNFDDDYKNRLILYKDFYKKYKA